MLETFFDASRQLMCMATAEGFLRRVNPAWERTLGYSTGELFAAPLLDFVHPLDRSSTLRQMRILATGRPVAYFETRFRCRDGSYRTLAWTATPALDDGFHAIAFDITARHRAGRLISDLIEAAPDAMLVTKADGTIHLVNRLCGQMFHCESEELVGQPVEALVPSSLRSAHEARRREYTEDPHVRSMGALRELRAVRPDGTEFPAEISLGPVTIGDETFVVCAIRDTTARRRAQDALRESERALQHSNGLLNQQEAELLVAERIQALLIPESPTDLPGYDIAARTLAAEFTGGDLHDFLPMGHGRVGLVLGDVTGHGFGASLLMATTHAYARALVETSKGLCDLMQNIHRALHRELEPERFVSMLIVRLDTIEHTLTHVNAGHPSGFVLDENGEILTTMDSSTQPLALLPSIDPKEIGPIPMLPGQMALLMTDGLFEAQSPDGEEFGLERVLQVARAHRSAPAAGISSALYDAVRDFTGRVRPEDDITLMIVKRNR